MPKFSTFTNSPRLRLAILYSSVIGGILLILGYVTHRVLARISVQMVDREIDILSMSINARLEKSLITPNILPADINRTIPSICLTHRPCSPLKDSMFNNFIREDYHLQLLDNSGKALAAIGEKPGLFPQLSDFSSIRTVKDLQGTAYHLHHIRLKTTQNQDWGYLQVGRSVQKYDSYMMGLHWLIIAGIPFTMVVVGAASWWLAGVAMQPIYKSYSQMQRFTADASHELRTPIAAIKAMLEVAIVNLNTNDPEIRSTFLGLQRQTDRMNTLAQDLLLLSRLDFDPPNHVTSDSLRVSICLNEILQDLEEELAPLAMEAQVDLSYHFQSPKNLYILGNTNQVYRLFSNLITNAIEYTEPQGKVEIQLAHFQNYAVVIVQDSGIGIAKADLPHLFDRFYRIQQDRSRQTGGLGLGLAIVKAIVKAHGGQISIESEVGIGSRFKVRLDRILSSTSDRENGKERSEQKKLKSSIQTSVDSSDGDGEKKDGNRWFH